MKNIKSRLRPNINIEVYYIRNNKDYESLFKKSKTSFSSEGSMGISEIQNSEFQPLS